MGDEAISGADAVDTLFAFDGAGFRGSVGDTQPGLDADERCTGLGPDAQVGENGEVEADRLVVFAAFQRHLS